jgi:GNAT superfamily N-acetyltransferase
LPPSSRIIGFYALSPHAIDRERLPQDKTLPRHERLSAIYLSMIAVDTSVQGKGIGSFLTANALAKCVDIADLGGGRYVVLDALNENAARLYRRLGFVDLPSQPLRMVIAMATVRKAINRPVTTSPAIVAATPPRPP